MKVIHLVSDISLINYGVWNVVIAVFPYLKEMGWEAEVWFPEGNEVPEEIGKLKYRIISKADAESWKVEGGSWKLEDRSWKVEDGGWKMEAGRSKMEAGRSKMEDGRWRMEDGRWEANDTNQDGDIKDKQRNQSSILKPQSSIVISHGCWSWATKTGYRMKKMGYPWIAVPHGMLEPWSMKQKHFKKLFYFNLFEYPKLKKADVLIAVGGPEYDNLRKRFSNVHHIPNGIDPVERVKGGRVDQDNGGRVEQDSGGRVEQWKSQLSQNINLPENNNEIDQSQSAPVDSSTRQHVFYTFTFLGRLHHKKGVVPLVRAWLKSSLYNDPDFQLVIAGPDEGEGPALKALIEDGGWKMEDGRSKIEDGRSKIEDGRSKIEDGSSKIEDGRSKIEGKYQEGDTKDKQHNQSSIHNRQSSNISITGPVYGKEKAGLLLKTVYFILPSQSEGFPTSILEAMTHGCIPVFTEGCNFPEAFEAGVGERIEFDVENIRKKLEEIKEWKKDQINLMSAKAKKFADENYNWRDIAKQQVKLYEGIINKGNKI